MAATMTHRRPRRFQSTRPIRGATPKALQIRGDVRFQSTRPIRGATTSSIGASCLSINFNPRAPYGARHVASVAVNHAVSISIHAPHTGRDAPVTVGQRNARRFQSTRPIRGATAHSSSVFTHDLLFQSTRPIRGATRPSSCRGPLPYFNPRAPYGARPAPRARHISSTVDFNPRAPYGARRKRSRLLPGYIPHFNPRAPYGARQSR